MRLDLAKKTSENPFFSEKIRKERGRGQDNKRFFLAKPKNRLNSFLTFLERFWRYRYISLHRWVLLIEQNLAEKKDPRKNHFFMKYHGRRIGDFALLHLTNEFLFIGTDKGRFFEFDFCGTTMYQNAQKVHLRGGFYEDLVLPNHLEQKGTSILILEAAVKIEESGCFHNILNFYSNVG